MGDARTIALSLSSGSEYRAGRWVGRVVALGSCWPLWYAFFGKSTLDSDALSFGGPGVLAGLLLWWWSGYQLRNPRTALILDHAGEEVRLMRRGVQVAECALAELRGWTYRTWQSTYTSQGTRHTTTWHAARCPALGDQDLFVDTEREAVEAWVARVEQARHAPFDYEPEEAWASALDRRVAAASGWPALVVLTVVSGLWLAGGFLVLADQNQSFSEGALPLAVVSALLAVAWRVSGRRIVGIAWAGLTGLAFATKLWLVPMTSSFLGELHRVSPTSESGFYYLLPGLALIGLAGLMVYVKPPPARAPKRPALKGATTRQQVIATKLPPPRAGPEP